ncbi:ABC transporter permease [Clostridium muellerianum]|uniref:ABC transporter permease n=1 Tax=Clostridium muellerianum TaxID=2716538 RepID=UPI003CC96E0B
MALLRLIQIEFLKLRRRKFVWIMMLSAFIMPFLAFLLFKYAKKIGVDPLQFYRWSAFGYTMFIILPFVLGVLCTMLMYEENQYDMLKQLWIVPISKMGYFFSKFFVVLIYSICFMLITAVASVMFSMLSGYVVFQWGGVLFLLKKCLEIGVITAFAMLPIFAIAASQKGYILPVSISLVYAFLGFILMPINMYLHPLSSMSVIVLGNIPSIAVPRPINVPLAFLCICIWDVIAILLVNVTLKRMK